MKTDKQIYTLLGADPYFLRVLTEGIAVRGPYLFEALDVKGLKRRIDGVLILRVQDEDIWAIEFQSWLMARFKSLSLEEILKMLGELTPLEKTRAYKELVVKGVAIGRQEGRWREARRLVLLLASAAHRRGA